MRNALLGALFIAAAAAANADMALAYHGKLVPAGGGAKISTKVPMTIEFRLYYHAQPGETAPLWGRAMPVRFDNDGMFYVELSDDAGSPVPEALAEKLADALVFGDAYWIGLSIGEFSEMRPRQKLVSVPRALTAGTARSTAVLKAPSLSVKTLEAGSAKLDSLTVGDTLRQSAGTTSLTASGGQTLSASGVLRLTEKMHGVNIDNTSGGLPATAPTDMIIMTKDASGVHGGGWSSIAVPKGATLRNLGTHKVAVSFGKGL